MAISGQTSERVIKDVICSFCGCVCDDLEIFLDEQDQIIGTVYACRISYEKFINAQKHRLLKPVITKNGTKKEVSVDEAIEHAAEILTQAKRPLLYGWSCVPIEAIKVGIEIAERTGAVTDSTASVCHGPSALAVQNVGISTCTLGEIKNRADLIIYWGCNPIHAHPRHISRYSLFPRGYFREKGRRQRKFIVIDVRKTTTAELADLFIQIEPGTDYEVLSALRAYLNGLELPESVGGIPKESLERLIKFCKGAQFVTVFFGMGLTMSRGKHRNIDNAINFVTDLSQFTKAVIMPLRGHYNVAGYGRVASWQISFPFATDLSRKYPRYYPGETSSVDLLCRNEADAAMIVGSDPVSHFPLPASQHLKRIPLIALAPHWSPTVEIADVVIPTTITGVDQSGTAYRMDGVPLFLKKIVDPPEGVLSDHEILTRLLSRIKALSQEKK
ncbi:MAG: formylmethanofuran dehydrogenase subunit B [Promethearchaeota archaeon]